MRGDGGAAPALWTQGEKERAARPPVLSLDLVTRPSFKAFYRATFVLYIESFLTCPCIVPIQARCLFGSGCVLMPYSG